mgnify:CR=1 FL=1
MIFCLRNGTVHFLIFLLQKTVDLKWIDIIFNIKQINPNLSLQLHNGKRLLSDSWFRTWCLWSWNCQGVHTADFHLVYVVYRYKTLALKWHPKLSKYDPDLTYHNFCEISEAYEVLGDSTWLLEYSPYQRIGYKRAFYDKYGEEQLKDGFIVDGSKNILLMK